MKMELELLKDIQANELECVWLYLIIWHVSRRGHIDTNCDLFKIVKGPKWDWRRKTLKAARGLHAFSHSKAVY